MPIRRRRLPWQVNISVALNFVLLLAFQFASFDNAAAGGHAQSIKA